jgi:hypothetical protein
MTHKERVDWILDIMGQVNPYKRQEANRKGEYYIYNMGYLASFLASKMEEDPFIAREFYRHAQEQSKGKLR